MASDTLSPIAIYRDNPLIEACGPILSKEAMFQKLSHLPEPPSAIRNIPFHERRHMILELWNLHIPTQVGMEIAAVITEMIMQGYSQCRPGTPEFFRRFYKNPLPVFHPIASSVEGISGMGKTVAIDRALRLFNQFVVHKQFPGYVSPVTQLIWLKVDAPASGKLIDLAVNLMRALDNALGTEHFEKALSKNSKRGADLFNEWLGIANKYFLGFIVIDEIQNLFKLAPLKARRSRQDTFSPKHELRLVEDEVLKLILSITNTWGIPVMVSGTPDGIGALGTRMAVAQRIASHGYHQFLRPSSSTDSTFRNCTLEGLAQYQWVTNHVQLDDQFADLFYSLTAGVPRICNALWIAAHSVAFDEGRDELKHNDFIHASERHLSAIKPAVGALLSNDPGRLRRYEDVLPQKSFL
jgi:hypothetical protein